MPLHRYRHRAPTHGLARSGQPGAATEPSGTARDRPRARQHQPHSDAPCPPESAAAAQPRCGPDSSLGLGIPGTPGSPPAPTGAALSAAPAPPRRQRAPPRPQGALQPPPPQRNHRPPPAGPGPARTVAADAVARRALPAHVPGRCGAFRAGHRTGPGRGSALPAPSGPVPPPPSPPAPRPPARGRDVTEQQCAGAAPLGGSHGPRQPRMRKRERAGWRRLRRARVRGCLKQTKNQTPTLPSIRGTGCSQRCRGG